MSGRQTTVIRYGPLFGPLTADDAAALERFRANALTLGYAVLRSEVDSPAGADPAERRTTVVAVRTGLRISSSPTARGGSAQTHHHDSNRA